MYSVQVAEMMFQGNRKSMNTICSLRNNYLDLLHLPAVSVLLQVLLSLRGLAAALAFALSFALP